MPLRHFLLNNEALVLMHKLHLFLAEIYSFQCKQTVCSKEER